MTPPAVGDWQVDHSARGGGPPQTQWCDTEADADALVADLVRLHGGKAVAWRWRG